MIDLDDKEKKQNKREHSNLIIPSLGTLGTCEGKLQLVCNLKSWGTLSYLWWNASEYLYSAHLASR